MNSEKKAKELFSFFKIQIINIIPQVNLISESTIDNIASIVATSYAQGKLDLLEDITNIDDKEYQGNIYYWEDVKNETKKIISF